MQAWDLRHHYHFDIVLEFKEKTEDSDHGYFYRYNCGGTTFWFVQHEDNGNIYALYIQLDDLVKSPININLYSSDYSKPWYGRQEYFYPWCPHISFASLNNLSIENALQFNKDLEYASAVIQAIAKFMLTSEHYQYYLEKGGKEIVFSV
jgi:hypothetical protein